jgi:photosystem II stability/assembly factor-like uncharacterized protein
MHKRSFFQKGSAETLLLIFMTLSSLGLLGSMSSEQILSIVTKISGEAPAAMVQQIKTSQSPQNPVNVEVIEITSEVAQAKPTLVSKTGQGTISAPEIIYTHGTSDSFLDIDCDGDACFAAGRFLYSSNRNGKDWDKIYSQKTMSVSDKFNAISCSDQTCVAAGDNGILLSSSNRGATWKQSLTPLPLTDSDQFRSTFFDVECPTSLTCYASGLHFFRGSGNKPEASQAKGNLLIKSVDGGITWSTVVRANRPGEVADEELEWSNSEKTRKDALVSQGNTVDFYFSITSIDCLDQMRCATSGNKRLLATTEDGFKTMNVTQHHIDPRYQEHRHHDNDGNPLWGNGEIIAGQPFTGVSIAGDYSPVAVSLENKRRVFYKGNSS